MTQMSTFEGSQKSSSYSTAVGNLRRLYYCTYIVTPLLKKLSLFRRFSTYYRR